MIETPLVGRSLERKKRNDLRGETAVATRPSGGRSIHQMLLGDWIASFHEKVLLRLLIFVASQPDGRPSDCQHHVSGTADERSGGGHLTQPDFIRLRIYANTVVAAPRGHPFVVPCGALLTFDSEYSSGSGSNLAAWSKRNRSTADEASHWRPSRLGPGQASTLPSLSATILLAFMTSSSSPSRNK